MTAPVNGRIDSAEVIEVIKTVHLTGAGTPLDVARLMTSYWSRDGLLLACDDPAPTVARLVKELVDVIDRGREPDEATKTEAMAAIFEATCPWRLP